MALIDGGEFILQVTRFFARPQKQDARRLECEMQQAQHFLLGGRLEIDQQVPTRHQVHLRERRVVQQVVLRKDDHPADVRVDLITPGLLGEIPPTPLQRHIPQRVFGINARRRQPERPMMRVGGEDLYLRLHPTPPRLLVDQDRQRVCLLARGAPRDPHPDRRPGGPPFEHPRQHVLSHRLDRRRVAEEPRHADQQIVIQLLDFIRVVADVLQITAQISAVRQVDPTLQSATDRCRFVLREINAEPVVQPIEQLLPVRGDALTERTAGGLRIPKGRIRLVAHRTGVLGEPDDRLGHLRRRQPGTHHPGRFGRRRHAVELGRRRVLGEHQSSGGVNVLRTLGTVAAGARQYDRHRTLAGFAGDRTEQNVDRVVDHAVVAGPQPQPSGLDG